MLEQVKTPLDSSVARDRVWPQMADFTQRLGAAAVDWLLMLAVGQLIALPFTAFWSQYGPYGRFVGLAVVLTYFGVMNSSIGKGQTVGKRLLKIAVRGRDNRPIGLGRSLPRILILATPLFLYGWELPGLQAPEMSWLTGLLVFGLGAAIIYTVGLNVEARQGIHDMVCGTYVVDLASVPVDEFARSERYHWMVSVAMVGLAAIACQMWNTLPPPTEVKSALQDIQAFKAALQGDPRFFSAQVAATGQYASALEADVWSREARTEEQQRQLRLEIARLGMEDVPRIYQFDQFEINVRYAYDLGIAAGNAGSKEIHWIPVWRKLLGENPAP